MLALARTEPDEIVHHEAVFTLYGSITTAGQTVSHTQYLTPDFVVTEFGRSLIVHNASLGGRYVVDRIEHRLRAIDLASQRIQIEHLRQLVGAVTVHLEEEEMEIDGFRCRRYRLCNDGSRIVISAEAYCARLNGIGDTALHEERKLEAELHPFALPLERDEIVVRSSTRTFTNGFQHLQQYQLLRLLPRIDDLASLAGLMSYPRTDQFGV
jgi:hypothetical protein